ncbi:MAG: alpha/beta fold hydrolase [Haloplanus sp.]
MVPDPTAPSTDSVTVEAVSIRDGHRVSYAEYGDPDGVPVVFLHGTPGSHRLGGLFADAARRHGVRLLAIDRPGYGQSSPWPARDLTRTGAFVTPVLDDAGVARAGVVGFSGGGPHALALAATHGNRVAEVDLVAGATPPALTPHTPTIQRLVGRLATTTPLVLSGLFRGQAWLADRVPAVVVSQYTAEPAALPDGVATLVARDFVEAVGHTRSGAVTELRMLAAEWDISLAAIDHRVRLWHGARDSNVPVEGARNLRDRLPNARSTVFEDADHLTTLLRSRVPVVERHAD